MAEKTHADILENLRKAQRTDDVEVAHVAADNALCEPLRRLGYDDVVEEWQRVDKWYA